MFPLPRAALCENERLKKTKLLSALKHLQVDREGTGDASESSLPRRKATPLCLERHWVCSSQQGSTACEERAVVRVTIALWRRGLVWGLKAVVLLLYHVACYRHVHGVIPVAAGGRKLEENTRPCRETADWKTGGSSLFGQQQNEPNSSVWMSPTSPH